MQQTVSVMEAYPNQHLLYNKSLWVLVHDAIRKLTTEHPKTEITNRVITDFIINNHLNGTLVKDEARKLRRRVTETTTEMTTRNMIERTIKPTGLKTNYYVFTLKTT